MQLWVFLHILSAIVAFGVLFSQPLVARAVDGVGESFAKVGLYIQAPALGVLFVTGVLAAVASPVDGIFKQTWISAAFVVWLAMAVVLYLLINAHRKGTPAVAPLSGVMHLLLVVALFLMIWQPGA